MSTVQGGPSGQDGPPVPSATGTGTAAAPAEVGGGLSAGPGAGAAGPALSVATGQAPVPVRASGVQLLGGTKGSGYKEPPSLVRRADGQTIQLTRLLYLVLEAIDGRRGLDEIAEHASNKFGRLVSADNVQTLIDSQLLPLGLLRLADGSEPEVRKSNPLLGMRFRYSVTDPDRTRKLAAPFAVLFNPFIVVAVTAAFLATCWWVLMVKGLASATHDAFANPGLVLLILVVTVFSAGFHEFGHAAAARRGGATPGAMGMGLYLMWPAFYTDVTDSYRLGRGGRLRTDLGGLYFNAIVAVGIMGLWWATGFDALLLVVVTQILQMVRQLMPMVRFDGYHILADATGVPDLFQRIKPTLLAFVPWRRTDPQAGLLKPWARAVVTIWVLVTVPLLLFSMVTMVLTLPRILGTAWDNGWKQQAMLSHSLSTGNVADAAVRVVAIACIALPVLGIFYILLRLVRQFATRLWQKTRGRAWQRATAVAAIAAVVAGLAWAWWPGANTYRPVQPYERGTLADATAAVFPAAAAGRLAEGQSGRTVALWPAGTRKPTRDEPQLGMVLVPRQTTPGTAVGTGAAGTTAAPSWVFPFDKPAPPEDDGNQSLAVNTTDGSVVYDVAFALVWADDGDTVDTRNEAYAFANCQDCAAVAVGFQVVLVVGKADVIVPENLSAAANYNCVRCLTYALASQLVLTLDGPLSAEGMSRLDALWQEIAAYGRDLRNVPLSEIQGRLSAYKEQLMEIIKADPSATPAGPSGTPATPGATTQPPSGSTGAPSPGAPEQGPPTGGTSTSVPAPADTAAGPAPAETAQPAPPAQPAPSGGTGAETATAPAPAPGTASAAPTAAAPPAP
jgi:putative peptide zinc metalloprotease protein